MQDKDKKSDFWSAYEAGRQAYLDSPQESPLPDPAGDEDDRGRFRAMGKWKFIVVRGMVIFGIPLLFWSLISNPWGFIESVKSSRHGFHPNLMAALACALLLIVVFGGIVGLLAWRRLTSDYWPRTKADPESTFVRIDPL